jgi:hypothetical protein
MRNPHQKTTNDVLVDDPDAAMPRMTAATCHILSISKSGLSHPKPHRKARKPKK